jgi:cell division protein FtsB
MLKKQLYPNLKSNSTIAFALSSDMNSSFTSILCSKLSFNRDNLKDVTRVSRMIEMKVAVLGVIVAALVIASFAMYTVYYTPTVDRLNSQVATQQDQLDSRDAQISNLNSQITNLQSQIANLQTQIDALESSGSSEYALLQSQIASLQSQLLNATALIAQLQGPTGILPTYMDIGWVGSDLNHGNYFLQLSLKNTGNVPINQIYITINSVQMGMTFTYLNNTVSAATPLPPYEIATGIQDVTPPVEHTDTYPLLIQATATNGTIYTYQTTITSHV